MKIKLYYLTFLITSVAINLPWKANAHCQIPCGIYDDTARVERMLEDAATIKKSIKAIIELSGKTDVQSSNQMTRWIENKEKHAQHIIRLISDYFLTQRIKTSQKNYVERLVKHHAVITAAMKTKQHAALKYVNELEQSIHALFTFYPENKK